PSTRTSAARAHPCARSGTGRKRRTPESPSLLRVARIALDVSGFPALVRAHDALHERMAHDVPGREEREADAVDASQYFDRVAQARLHVARQVDLRDIAGNDGRGAEADACQEHLHLFDRRVLRFVEDYERIVERAAAHIGERGDFDDIALDQAHDLVDAEHLVKRIVERAQIRIDFLGQVAGKKAELLAGFDRRPHENQPLYAVFVQRIDRHRHGEVGLAGAGRADAEVDVVRGDRVQVALLVRAAPMHGAALDLDRDLVRALGGFRVERVDSGFGQAQVDLWSGQRLGFCRVVQIVQHALGQPDRMFRPAEAKLVAAVGDLDAEAQFDLAQMFVERPAQVGQTLAVVRVERDFAVGQGSHAVFGKLMVAQDRAIGAAIEALNAAPMSIGSASWRPGNDQTQTWTFRA